MSKGLTVMFHELHTAISPDQKDAMDAYYGAAIKAIIMEDNKLRITFQDDRKVSIFDDGQSCCETRYMNTDDDLQDLVGKTLVHVKIKDAPEIEYGGEVHEVQFLEIMTNDGFATISNHNEHNGYYGGFVLTVKAEN